MTPAEFQQYVNEHSSPFGKAQEPATPYTPDENITDLPPPTEDLGAMAEQLTPMGRPGQSLSPAADEILSNSRPLSPTMGEIAEQATLGLGQGLKTVSSTMIPAFSGAVGGAKVGAFFPPPVSAVTVPTFSALGFLGGYTIGDKYSQYLDQFFPLPSREELIPYRVGATTMGEGLGTIPFAYAMPLMSGNMVSRFLSQIGETARRSPVLFGTSEAFGAGGAGTMGFFAESTDPGNETKRAVYEISGGLFTPGRWLSNLAATVTDNLSRRMASGDLTSSQRQAADQLLKILENYKEDPQELMKALTATLPVGVSPTAGQKTGSPALNALEATLAKEHDKYRGEIRGQGEAALEAYEALLSRLRSLGDIESLKTAAEVQNQRFNAMLTDRVVLAHKDAADKIAKISRLNPTTDARAYVGRITLDSINNSIRDARTIEHELWNSAYKNAIQKAKRLPDVDPGLFRDPTRSVTPEKLDSLRRMSSGKPDKVAEYGSFYSVGEVGGDTTKTPRAVYFDQRHLRRDFQEIVKEGNKLFRIEYDLDKAPPESLLPPVDVAAAREKYGMGSPQHTKAIKDAQNRSSWWYKTPLKRTEIKPEEVYVPKTLPGTSLKTQMLEIASKMTPERFNTGMSPYLKSLMGRFGIDENAITTYRQGRQTPEFAENGLIPDRFLPVFKDKPIDASELIEIRSEMLGEARRAASGNSPDPDMARIYGDFAQAALNDLSTLNSPDYDTAREFSRALNDVYTRTFAGEAVAKDARGAAKIPPEILVETAFNAGSDLVALRMQQIEDSASFLLNRGREIVEQNPDSDAAKLLKKMIPDAKQRIDSLTDAQNVVVRLAAAQNIKPTVVDPATGRIEMRLDVPGLVAWAAENNDLVRKAGLAGDLSDAAKAENLYRLMVDQNSKINQSLRKRTAFGQLLGAESPTTVVTSVLRSKNPEAGMRRLVLLAKKSGPDAVDGLRATVMDYAFTQASKNNAFSPMVFEKAMFKPLGPNQPSLYGLMRNQGIMDVSHGNNIRALINPMKRIEAELAGGQTLDAAVSRLGLIGQFGSRFLGAQVGSAISRLAGGAGTIQIPAYGASVAQDIFDKLPALSVRAVLEDATKDPKFMAMILDKRAVIPREKIRMARQMHAYLVSQGYTDADYTEPEETEVPATPTTGMPASQLLRQLPPAPPTTGVPGLRSAPSVTPQGPRPGPVAPPATPPMPGQQPQASSRQMLQSLFPFDTTLGLGSPRQ